MANAFKCDRCGDFKQGRPAATVEFDFVVTPAGMPPNGNIDLCNECGQDFKHWIKTVERAARN